MKKLVVALSAIALSMTVATTAQARQQVGPAYQEGSYGYVCTHSANGTVILRKGAGQNFGAITKMPNGSDVSVLSQTRAKDGFVWYNVRYGKLKGWARSDYICGQ